MSKIQRMLILTTIIEPEKKDMFIIAIILKSNRAQKMLVYEDDSRNLLEPLFIKFIYVLLIYLTYIIYFI